MIEPTCLAGGQDVEWEQGDTQASGLVAQVKEHVWS
jgi:hypothetical protein